MSRSSDFRAVYEKPGVYDDVILAHYFDGAEDVDLVSTRFLHDLDTHPASLDVIEFGCGTGRITASLAPFARALTLADYSDTMLRAAGRRFPAAELRRGDTRDVVRQLLAEGRAGCFDIVGAFWSLSYPLGEFFEQMTSAGIERVDDAHSRGRATQFVLDAVSLVSPGGRFLALHFDSECAEQQLVTQIWEQIEPFPESGRGYTLELLLSGLRQAEQLGWGSLEHARLEGTAWAPDEDAAQAWFDKVHLKGFPALVNNPGVRKKVRDFVREHVDDCGHVHLPSGVHLVQFRATGSRPVDRD